MIKKTLFLFKERLTTVGSDEPLNKLSLAVIILLDIFVLNILFMGLHDHTKQLTSPDEYMPYNVRQVFVEQSWTPANRIEKLQRMVLTDRNRISYRSDSLFETGKIKRMHPLCQDFYTQVKALSTDPELPDLFVSCKQETAERNRLTSSMRKAKQAYDTRLLENIANQNSQKTESIARRVQNLTSRIESLTEQISNTKKQIHAHPGVQELWALISPDNQNRQTVIDDYRRFEKWYSVRELGWQLLFMLPIFGLFYVWSARSIKKDNRIQTLITSHMLVIASLPILFKVIELVIDLIPNHFFRNLFKFLKSIHLIAIWHYVVIIGSIAVGLFLIFLIQKKVFNKQKVMQKRLTKGACIRCSKKLPAGAAICPFCGTKQRTACTACGKETPSAGAYCIHCGAGQKEIN